MGGDYAPQEVVRGALIAAGEEGVEILLVGPQAILNQELAKYNHTPPNLRCIEASQVISDNEHPALALRRKPDASVAVAARLVRKGEADAMVSAGSTGALTASALQYIGSLEGIHRPVIAGAFVGFAPQTAVLDLGANVDCKPYQLLNFAILGHVYAQKFYNIPNPTIAILSVGAEKSKGNELVQQSYELLEKSGLNFIGNVEGNDIPQGKANVIVCDGFVGNILVKFCESLGVTIGEWLHEKLKDEVNATRIETVISELRNLTNMAEVAGGSVLLGLEGVAVISHGRSQADEIARAINEARKAVETNFVAEVKSVLARVQQTIHPPEGGDLR